MILLHDGSPWTAMHEPSFNEKSDTISIHAPKSGSLNPVIESAHFALKVTDIVHIDNDAVKSAARLIHTKMQSQAYTPRTWRTHALHILPHEPYHPEHPGNKQVMDWIFLISALNFSFWSVYEDSEEAERLRFGVEWRKGWGETDKVVWTGYWSIVAALNRALEEGIPITDPHFYSSSKRCSDETIRHIFRPAEGSREVISLLDERIRIMREVGSILCASFGGSFQGFINAYHLQTDTAGTALGLVKYIAHTFPSFRDEVANFHGKRIYMWKRAQICVAELWAAFYPPTTASSHPLFPGAAGAKIEELTMFADYRVPQILHHLRIIAYPPSLVALLESRALLSSGCNEEVSIRAASIVAVERVKEEMVAMGVEGVSSVLIDFFLWDEAKMVETGEDVIEGYDTERVLPAHRIRSTWY